MGPGPYDLPARPTPLIGREEDVAAAKQRLLDECARLLTFLGPPGIGKTRLALEIAARVAAEFRDWVFFVDLTTVTAAPLVLQTIAGAFGLADSPHESTVPRLQRHLHGRRALVVLDNCEHVIDAADDISELLSACGGLQIIATSREPLRLRWEQQFAVTPLGLPDLARRHSAETIVRSPAVRLFVERARAVARAFALTEDSARAVAEICVRLDGIPLAIELAAARVNVFEPRDILERLRQRLTLLAAGPRDAPARHQTLRDAIAWSYNLLARREQMLFRRLAVFEGSGSLEAVRSVCYGAGDVGDDVLDGVTALVDRHLVSKIAAEAEEPRFGMLESLREFGLEQLESHRELSDVQRAHAGFFLDVAEDAQPGMAAHLQFVFDRLEPDRSNLRAAIEWFLANGEAESALRVMGSAEGLWGIQGYFPEIGGLLQRCLDAAGTGPSMMRWRILTQGAQWAFMRGALQSAVPVAAESLELARALGDNEAIAYSLLTSAWIARDRRDFDGATTYFEEALELSRRLANKTPLSMTLCALGTLARLQGDCPRATALVRESLSLAVSVDDAYQICTALGALGSVALDDGRHEEAEVFLKDALARARRGSFRFIMTWVIDELARASCAGQDLARTATLLGAVGNLRETLAISPMGSFRTQRDQTLAAARAGLAEEAFERAWADGRAMSLAEMIDYALGQAGPGGDRPTPA